MSGVIKGAAFGVLGLTFGDSVITRSEQVGLVVLVGLGIGLLELLISYLPRRRWHEEMLLRDPDYEEKFLATLAEKGWYTLFSNDWIRYRANEFRKRRKTENHSARN